MHGYVVRGRSVRREVYRMCVVLGQVAVGGAAKGSVIAGAIGRMNSPLQAYRIPAIGWLETTGKGRLRCKTALFGRLRPEGV
ncbi:hypothetical protein THIOKS1540009 [Thiocapsa sp. KS1]|nr:hypothetical protein THIOKS1540009 [Thiocapsa sp. KS1]